MKKKIAVFAAGWGSEILSQFISGAISGLEEYSADMYLFLCYPLLVDTKSNIAGEINIFNLPNLSKFDGAMIFGNSIDFENAYENIVNACKKADIPTISCGREPDYGYYISSDNYQGMIEQCNHLKEKHDVKNVFYLAGSDNNPHSNIRFKAICDVFPDTKKDDIYYTNWDLSFSYKFIDEYIKSNKPLPDAFCCANDGIAIYAADALNDNGIKVPEDVIVTGFDDIYCSSVFDPTLSSVSQNFETIGSVAAKTLFKLFDNEIIEKSITVPCVFTARESCGCTGGECTEKLRRKLGRNIYVSRLDQNNFIQKLNALDAILLSGKEFSDIYTKLTDFFSQNSEFEKGNIHILLDPDYENSVLENTIELRTHGYSNYMYDIFSLTNGKISVNPVFDTSLIVPNISDEDNENHIYICMPLHDNEKTIGYFVLRDLQDQIDNSDTLVRYEQRFNSIFVKYRQNLYTNYLNNKLKIINETDPLTKVKNRNAYDAKAMEYAELIRTGKMQDFAVAIFDINNLKTVNDSLGHEKGDEYIVNSCKLLCDVFKHCPVFRLGGDEFLIYIIGEDYVDREHLIDELKNKMMVLSETEINPSKRISIAYGVSEYNRETDHDLTEIFKRADNMMYEIKKQMKGTSLVR